MDSSPKAFSQACSADTRSCSSPPYSVLYCRLVTGVGFTTHPHRSNCLFLTGANGNPLLCSCLENPRDGGAWWLPSMGSHTVGHDWSDLAAAAAALGPAPCAGIRPLVPRYLFKYIKMQDLQLI